MIFFVYSIHRQNAHITLIFQPLKAIDEAKLREQLVGKCGRLLAAKRNLDDSLVYLCNQKPKSQRSMGQSL